MSSAIRPRHRFLSVTVFFLAISFSLLSSASSSRAQLQTRPPGAIDIPEFMDSAHHWRDITDEDHVIAPIPGQAKYPPSDVVHIANNVLLYQKANGGWPKNYDMQAILTDEQQSALKKTAGATNTTFDNGTTHSQVAYLAGAYAKTGDARYKEGCLKGIDYILSAQYENGGWPQFYPEARGYARYITFNDGAMIGLMTLLHHIVRDEPAYRFVDGARRDRVKRAFEKGLQCILDCQITDHGVLTVWCQQHDEKTLLPQPARTFEPACISNQESAGIAEFLMSIDHPSTRVIRSVESCVRWFTGSALSATRVETIPAPTVTYQYHTTASDRIVVNDAAAPPIWSRYTELGTHKALFSNRNWKQVYSLADVDRERRTGYAWYTYAPQRALDLYPAWKQKWVP